MMFALRYRRKQHQDPFLSYKGHDHDDDVVDEKSKSNRGSSNSNGDGTTQKNILSSEGGYIAVVTIIALAFRLWHIRTPASVTWTELEQCKQVNWYIHGKFFVGPYPPLSGLFYSALAQLFGYDGSEEILYGDQHLNIFPLTALRMATAVLGSFLVPMAYLMVRLLGHCRTTALTATGLVLLENGFITQSKLAIPDVLLTVLTAAAGLCWIVQFRKQEREPFNVHWGWQAATGLSMGLALSAKWHALPLFPMVWASSISYLWRALGEKRFSMTFVYAQLVSRLVTTLALPIIVYLLVFQYHFHLVPKAGDHDLLVSSRLRYSLEGNSFEKTQQPIAYGSVVVLKHTGTNGGYLHSHLQRYTTGSTQQQVTLYPHADVNNLWMIHKAGEIWNSSRPLEYVKNNDQIMLEHVTTTRKLHSHDHKPPVSGRSEQNEVSAYGDQLVRDPYDYWWIRVVAPDGKVDVDNTSPVLALSQEIRLFHIRGCYLLSHNVPLDKDSGSQQEVTCMMSGKQSLSTWTIEAAHHEELGEDEDILIGYEKPSFTSKLVEVHELMYSYVAVVHDRLRPTAAGAEEVVLQTMLKRGKPLGWLLGKNPSYRIWDTVSGRAIYVTLNPISQILLLSSMAICVAYLALETVVRKRQGKLPSFLSWTSHDGASLGYDPIAKRDLYYQSIGYLSTCTLAHAFALYAIPSFAQKMSDILPGHFFGAGLSAVVLEAIVFRLGRRCRIFACVSVLLLAAYPFFRFLSLTYGSKPWTRMECSSKAAVLKLECDRFPLQDVVSNATFYIPMPGRTMPYRYQVGSEAQAEEHIAALHRQAFTEAAQEATGSLRYHRALQTPPPTQEEIALWQDQILEVALERVEQEAKAAKAKEDQEQEQEQGEQDAYRDVDEETDD